MEIVIVIFNLLKEDHKKEPLPIIFFLRNSTGLLSCILLNFLKILVLIIVIVIILMILLNLIDYIISLIIIIIITKIIITVIILITLMKIEMMMNNFMMRLNCLRIDKKIMDLEDLVCNRIQLFSLNLY